MYALYVAPYVAIRINNLAPQSMKRLIFDGGPAAGVSPDARFAPTGRLNKAFDVVYDAEACGVPVAGVITVARSVHMASTRLRTHGGQRCTSTYKFSKPA